MKAAYWIKPVFFSTTSAEMWFVEQSPVMLVRVEIREKKFKAFVFSWANTDVLIPGLNYLVVPNVNCCIWKTFNGKVVCRKNRWNAVNIKLICVIFKQLSIYI